MKSKINVLMIITISVICGFLFAACDEGTDIKNIRTIDGEFGGELVFIEGGTFKMGSPYAVGEANEQLHRDVTVDSFYMGKYQVTQEQWNAVMERNPSYWNGTPRREPENGETQAKRPVEQISWFDAVTFCNEVSIQETLTPYYMIDKSYIDDPNYDITENNLKGSITLSPAIPESGSTVEVTYNPGDGEDTNLSLYTFEWFKLVSIDSGDPSKGWRTEEAGTGSTSPVLNTPSPNNLAGLGLGDWFVVVTYTDAETEIVKNREYGLYVYNSSFSSSIPDNITVLGSGEDGYGTIRNRLTASYIGTGINYEWYRNGKPLNPRATGANFTPDLDGIYTVRVGINNSAMNPKFSDPVKVTTPLKWVISTDETSKGYRLPTEAQWEYACRAGSQSSRYFGGVDIQLVDYAWYNANSNGKTHEVGLKLPNAWGLYDMYGNVREWCWDWYNDSYDNAGGNNNPKGAEEGTARVMRGGTWNGSGLNLRSAYRENQNPLPPPPPDTAPERNSFNGMRLVRAE